MKKKKLNEGQINNPKCKQNFFFKSSAVNDSLTSGTHTHQTLTFSDVESWDSSRTGIMITVGHILYINMPF